MADRDNTVSITRSVRSPTGALVGVRAVWLLLVIAGMVFFLAHVTVGAGGAGLDDFASTWVYDGLEVLALAAIAARAVLVKEERDVWTLLAIGVACWTLGDILWSVAYAGNPPFPSVADAFYLAFYPPTYLALVLLVRHRISRFNASVWLDGLAAFLTVAAVGAAVLLEVVFASNEGKLSAEAVNLAYPLGRHRPPGARRRRLRDRELAAREGVGADRRRACALGARRRRLPVRVGGRVVHVRDDPRCALACGAPPARVRRLELVDAPDRPAGSRAGRSAPRRRSAGWSRSACSSTATSSTGTPPA